MHKVDTQQLAGALLALISVVVAVTCATSGDLSRAPAAPAALAASGEASGAQPGAAPGSGVVAAPAAAAQVAASKKRPVLSRFCGALAGLAGKTRKDHLRITWWGDSHTYADFLTDAVRQPLQHEYGGGGPGFLHLGIEGYRHASVKVKVEGTWRREPKAPSRSSRFDDGVFGLGGMRATAEAADAKTSVKLLRGAISAEAEWQLMYRLRKPADSFRVEIDGEKPRTLSGQTGAGSRVQLLKLSGKPDGVLAVNVLSGHPELLGVTVEDSTPGVVLDTLGINGARAATPLAWDASHFAELVRARHPELVVLAYGTNEVFDDREPERYEKHYEELLARLRSAHPDFDCLMLGPTDADLKDGSSNPRVMAIDQVERSAAARLGCAYFSLFQAMGGEGSMTRWAEARPRLAAKDRIHLSSQGYERVGAGIARWLLAACE